ncbi:hypothetical protein [Actinophytocola sp.]|uniref:hypothetical protein n=1 Tax=Actinophytocola sp. TaxID=1872138 RepID=UPI003D6A328D
MGKKRTWLVGGVVAVVVLLVVGVGWWWLSDDSVLWTEEFQVTDVLAASGDRAIVKVEDDRYPRILDLRNGDMGNGLQLRVHAVVSLDDTGSGLGWDGGGLVAWDARGRTVWWESAGNDGYVAAITPDTVVLNLCEGNYGDGGPATLVGLRRADGSEAWRGESGCGEEWKSVPPVVVDVDEYPGRLRLLDADTGAVVTDRPVAAATWSPGGQVIAHDGDEMWALSAEGRELWRTGRSASPCPGRYGIFGSLFYGVYPYVYCTSDGAGEVTALIDPNSGDGRELTVEPNEVSAIIGLGYLGDSVRLDEGEQDDPTRRWAITLEGDVLVAEDWMTGERQWTRETGDLSCTGLTLPVDATWRYGTVLLHCGGEDGGEPTDAWLLDFRTGEVVAHTARDEEDGLYPLPAARALVARNGTTDLIGRG